MPPLPLRGGPLCGLEKGLGRDTRRESRSSPDRDTTSNAVHQTGKLPESEWEDFCAGSRFLNTVSWGPRPSLVLYLDMPTEQAVENPPPPEGRDPHHRGYP